jgi:hypothetical protein
MNQEREFARIEELYQAAKRTAEGYHNAGDLGKSIKYWRIAAELSEKTFHMLKKRAEDLSEKEGQENPPGVFDVKEVYENGSK